MTERMQSRRMASHLLGLGLGLLGCGATKNDAGAKMSCSDWAALQDGGGVPAGSGTVAEQRASLLAAGGGIATVGTKYYVTYFPAAFATSARKRVLVNLHGTGGSPEAEWNDFRASLDARGWGFLGLKYLDDATGFYDDDETIYANLVAAVQEARSGCDLASAQLFLFGFSRGSAKTFAMAYLDNRGERLFTAFGSSSGGAWQQPSDCAWTTGGGACAWQPADPLFPSECALGSAPASSCACDSFVSGVAPAKAQKPSFAQTILAQRDAAAYAGSSFWAYCGERDYHDGYRQCGDMEMSKVFVEAFGGRVDELYAAGSADGCVPWAGTTCIASVDTRCGHGSLKNQAAAWGRMWSYFESL